MNTHRGTNVFHHSAYSSGYTQTDTHANSNVQAESSQTHTTVDQELLQRYTRNTLEKTKNIQEATKELNLKHSMPFDTDSFQSLIYQKFPEVKEAVPPEERNKGICLGLSMVWLKHRLEGKSDTDFHQSLLNPEHDSALLQAMGAQYIEQRWAPSEEPCSISETVAPKLGMSLIAGSKTQVSRTMPIIPLLRFANEMDNTTYQQKRPQQGFLLLTDGHAMALHRGADNQLHFFDPNFGVISSQAENRTTLYAFMSESIGNLPTNNSNNIYVTEVQPKPKPEPMRTPLYVLNLST